MRTVEEKLERIESLQGELEALQEDLYGLVRDKVSELGTVISSQILDKDAAYVSRLKRGVEPVRLGRLKAIVKELYRV